MSPKERVEGGILGLLIGDALGVPYEFHDPSNLPPREALELDPPPAFRRSHAGVPPGTWSDDGAQALALLASLLDRGTLDVEDLGRRFVAWWAKGDYAVDARPFDIGNQTGDALLQLEAGVPAEQAGGRGERDNGNGSLMRVLPLALWHRGTDAELVRDAHRQSRVTHGHPRSEAACGLYCLWARAILEERPDPFGDAVKRARAVHGTMDVHAAELERLLRPYPFRGSGYVVDTLHSARHALEQPTYERVVREAVALGLDTDTTAAVAGGLAGLRHGVQGIPERWRTALRGREILDPLLARLLERW